MKKWIVLPLLLALLGCGDDSGKGNEKKEIKVKAAAKDATTAELEKKNAALEAHMKELEGMVTELKNKQEQVDDMLTIYETVKKGKSNTENKK